MPLPRDRPPQPDSARQSSLVSFAQHSPGVREFDNGSSGLAEPLPLEGLVGTKGPSLGLAGPRGWATCTAVS
eukprot:15432712-Alexandrium_andersonii.AAC.1